MSSSATKMRSSRWRTRSGLFISKGEDAAQRLHMGKYPLNVHGLRRRSKAISVFSSIGEIARPLVISSSTVYRVLKNNRRHPYHYIRVQLQAKF
jgi:hypothetical protein